MSLVRHGINEESKLPPNHLINHSRIGLDNLDDLCGDILVYVVRRRNSVVASGVHGDGGVHGLEDALLVDTSENKAGLPFPDVLQLCAEVSAYEAFGTGDEDSH